MRKLVGKTHGHPLSGATTASDNGLRPCGAFVSFPECLHIILWGVQFVSQLLGNLALSVAACPGRSCWCHELIAGFHPPGLVCMLFDPENRLTSLVESIFMLK